MTGKEEKTVPLATLLEEREKHKGKIKSLEEQVEKLQSEYDVLRAQVERQSIWGFEPTDEEEKSVKEKLISIEKRLQEREAQILESDKQLKKQQREFEAKLTDFQTRERSVRLKELASQYGIDEGVLRERVEAGESELEVALRLVSEKAKASPTVYERGAPGTSTKSVRDMTPEEFNRYREQMRAEHAKKARG